MAREQDLTSTSSFQGINNLDPEESLGIGALREAVNVDLVGNPERGIKPRLRPGRAAFVADVGAHSLWSDGQMPFALYAAGDGDLKALFPDRTTASIVSGLATGRRVSYARINDRIYWSNEQLTGLITLELESLPWGVDGPGRTPVCTPDAAGGLDAGTYQVAVTFIDRTGRESGTGVAQPTEVPAGGGVMLTDIPQPPDPVLVPTIRIYRSGSGANSDVLYRHFDVPTGTTEFLVGSRAPGAPLQTQLLVQMPAGHIVRALNGQLLVARGRELLVSPGLRYGMVDPARGRIGFPKRLTMVEPVGDSAPGAGVYVAAGDRTWFISGSNLTDREQVAQKIAKPYGVVPGSSLQVEAALLGLEGSQPVPVWLATSGQYCVGLPGGQVVTLKLDSAVADIGDAGATLFRESEGHRQLITALNNPRSTGLKITDKVTVREYQH